MKHSSVTSKFIFNYFLIFFCFTSLEALRSSKSRQIALHQSLKSQYVASTSRLFSTQISEIDEDESNFNDDSKVTSTSSLDIEEFITEKTKSTSTTSKKPKKEVPKKSTSRDLSGYVYQDKDGVYDVPILNESMWFQVQVVKNKEFLLRDYFLKLKTNMEDPSITKKVKNTIVDAYVPEQFYPKFKGKDLIPEPRPLTSGALYLKVKMDPDVADFIGNIRYIFISIKLIVLMHMHIILHLVVIS